MRFITNWGLQWKVRISGRFNVQKLRKINQNLSFLKYKIYRSDLFEYLKKFNRKIGYSEISQLYKLVYRDREMQEKGSLTFAYYLIKWGGCEISELPKNAHQTIFFRSDLSTYLKTSLTLDKEDLEETQKDRRSSLQEKRSSGQSSVRSTGSSTPTSSSSTSESSTSESSTTTSSYSKKSSDLSSLQFQISLGLWQVFLNCLSKLSII